MLQLVNFSFYICVMNAESILSKVSKALNDENLEAIVIGNAGGALLGSPVTTLDIDFYFRKTPTNLLKLKRVAKRLNATIFRPFYPLSGLFRVIGEDDGVYLDFMSEAHGIKSFASLRSRAQEFVIGKNKLLVASLEDIIKSKEASKRDRDNASLKILKATLKRQKVRTISQSKAKKLSKKS